MAGGRRQARWRKVLAEGGVLRCLNCIAFMTTTAASPYPRVEPHRCKSNKSKILSSIYAFNLLGKNVVIWNSDLINFAAGHSHSSLHWMAGCRSPPPPHSMKRYININNSQTTPALNNIFNCNIFWPNTELPCSFADAKRYKFLFPTNAGWNGI